MRKSIDLWGQTVYPPPKGLYAGQPGKGPAEYQCRDCHHFRRLTYSKTYFKCALTQPRWTGGAATDIQARAPACQHFSDTMGKVDPTRGLKCS